MKLTLIFAACISAITAIAQPKIVTQAIISTSTNVIAPDDDEDVTQIQGGNGGGGFNFRTMMDGEIKSTTYIKGDLTKTDYKSEVVKGTMYRDNAKKTTISIYEMMGNKQGVSTTDADAEIMKNKMDSAREARAKTDTGENKPRMRNVDPTVTIAYLEDTKKIAGYNCKKAIVITDRVIRKDSAIVWYTPEIKFSNVPSTGGMSGMGGMMAGRSNSGGNGFEKIDGFVMQYDSKMPRGRTMEVKVTKIVIDKEISDSEFNIPKDIEIKSMKEMGQGGGGMRMMMGGRPQ
jgi:GLPGLI family protein